LSGPSEPDHPLYTFARLNLFKGSSIKADGFDEKDFGPIIFFSGRPVDGRAPPPV